MVSRTIRLRAFGFFAHLKAAGREKSHVTEQSLERSSRLFRFGLNLRGFCIGEKARLEKLGAVKRVAEKSPAAEPQARRDKRGEPGATHHV
ncbi:hypothetical protein Tamer19_29840 [Cupriavidus sp. TA19]|nr:hypothetical protein Tamer19_29840 [Cupriavidus sp. TA19]